VRRLSSGLGLVENASHDTRDAVRCVRSKHALGQKNLGHSSACAQSIIAIILIGAEKMAKVTRSPEDFSRSSVRRQLSKRLLIALKTSDVRHYRLAHEIEVHPSTLSCWINGISSVPRDDPRILKLGALLGVPAGDCFEA
jgi:hypothetical protein